jgi:RimJ/RimL family protein N-acetyltransferase
VPTGIEGEVEIGWIFHKEFQGQGMCSEAVLDFLIPLAYEIKKMKVNVNGKPLSQIMATAHPQNIASNKIILKAGLHLYKQSERFEGKPRNWYKTLLGANDE